MSSAPNMSIMAPPGVFHGDDGLNFGFLDPGSVHRYKRWMAGGSSRLSPLALIVTVVNLIPVAFLWFTVSMQRRNEGLLEGSVEHYLQAMTGVGVVLAVALVAVTFWQALDKKASDPVEWRSRALKKGEFSELMAAVLTHIEVSEGPRVKKLEIGVDEAYRRGLPVSDVQPIVWVDIISSEQSKYRLFPIQIMNS